LEARISSAYETGWIFEKLNLCDVTEVILKVEDKRLDNSIDDARLGKAVVAGSSHSGLLLLLRVATTATAGTRCPEFTSTGAKQPHAPTKILFLGVWSPHAAGGN